MDTSELKEQILAKWPRGQILPDGLLKGSEHKTLSGIAIMLDMDITSDLEKAVQQLLAEGELCGHIDYHMTTRKNEVDSMIQLRIPNFHLNFS